MVASLRRIAAYVLPLFLVLTSASNAGPITNGDFETGDLSGWNVFNTSGSPPRGFAAAVTSQSGYQPIQGSHSAMLVVNSFYFGAGVPCSGDLWRPADCPYPPIPFPSTQPGGPSLTNPLFPDPGVPIRMGGVIGQDIDAHTGDVLSWDWQMLSQRDFNEDGIWAVLKKGTITTAITRNGTSDLAAASYQFPEAGVWTVYFGVSHGFLTQDNWFWSGLFLDNVTLREVPEPGPVALLSLGLAGLAFTRRRRQ